MNQSSPARVLPLQGGINFRDLGGYRMADGRYIKSGKLFRSGALHQLTTSDCHYLQRLPVNTILDYRDQDEVALQPDILWQGANYHLAPANPRQGQARADLESLTNQQLEALDTHAFMTELYQLLPFNNPAYHQLVKLLLDENTQGLVQHCAVGKDRTGVGVALVLLALGADQQTVISDYLLTETTLAPFRKTTLAKLAQRLSEKALAKCDNLFVAKEQFLRTALTSIGQRYGSTQHWLAQEYGLDQDQCQWLQARYLQDNPVA